MYVRGPLIVEGGSTNSPSREAVAEHLKQKFISHILEDTESNWLAGQPSVSRRTVNGYATYSQPRVEGGETRVTRPNGAWSQNGHVIVTLKQQTIMDVNI